MNHVFKLERTDNKGNVIKNQETDGTIKIMYDEYVYDFDLLTFDRTLMARKLFHFSEQDYAVSPKLISELEIMTSREAEKQAFAAILMKKTGDNWFFIR